MSLMSVICIITVWINVNYGVSETTMMRISFDRKMTPIRSFFTGIMFTILSLLLRQGKNPSLHDYQLHEEK